MPPIFKLPDDLARLLGVTKVYKTYAGGQKFVFIVSCGERMCAIKMFKFAFDKRDQRELEFYLQNEDIEGIPKVIKIVEFNKETVVVEDYIEGHPLSEIYESYKEDDDKIRTLVSDVCSIMEPIWNEGKTHRDLKPENIIIKPDGKPVIIDFGIYKNPDDSTITSTGFQPRSWGFASPEQLRGEKDHISYRTDFFCLGIIAYYLYHNYLPFGDNERDVTANLEVEPIPFVVQSECKLKHFFDTVFKRDVSMRPRNVKTYLKVLR